MHPRSCTVFNKPFRQDACSTRNTLFVEQAGKPVADNGGTGILHLPALYFKMLSLTELARSTNLFATFAAS